MLVLIFATQAAFAAPFSAEARTKTIPAGTRLKLQLIDPLTTYAGSKSDFSAILSGDKTSGADIVLPMGTLVRGHVRNIVPSERMSKGAVLYLDFDHIVTPNGRQLPLDLRVTGRSDVTYDGGIGGLTYKHALAENWHSTVDIVQTATDWGNDTFEDVAGGYVRVITVPAAAIGGTIGGGAYYFYEFFADMVKKGKDVYLPKGSVVEVILQKAVDVPLL